MGSSLRYFIAEDDRGDRRHVVDVLRILPVRHHVRQDGRLDVSAAARLALKRLEILEGVRAGDAGAQIEQLEADANYFWSPTDRQLRVLGTALLNRPSSPTQLQVCSVAAPGRGGAGGSCSLSAHERSRSGESH